jgi:hypothetical protein
MMNRSKSIKDIGNIYRAMQQASAAAATQINESVSTKKKSQKVKAKFPKDTFKRSEEVVKEPSTFKKGGPQNVKNLTKAKKNEKFSQKTKKLDEQGINKFMSIFDKLYEDVMKTDELNLNTGIGMGPEGSAGDVEDFDVDSETDSDSDESTESPKEMLQKAIDLLQQVADSMGDDEGSDESDTDLEDLGVDSDEDEDAEEEDDEHGMYETTDIEKLPDSAGHKLQKGFAAAGNIKASSGKADAKVTDTVGTETGKHPLDHKSELTNPSKNKVGSLKTGKSLFDQ